MPYGAMTVGELRKILENLPDESPVLIKPHDAEDFASCEPRRTRVKGEIVHTEGRPAKVWNYSPRELHNAYTANDDRYEENRILLLEISQNTGP